MFLEMGNGSSVLTWAFSYSSRVSTKIWYMKPRSFEDRRFLKFRAYRRYFQVLLWDAMKREMFPKIFSISCRNIYDREPIHCGHGITKWWRRDWAHRSFTMISITNLGETSFVLSKRFVTRWLLQVSIQNEFMWCEQSRGGFLNFFLEYSTRAFEGEINTDKNLGIVYSE